MEESKVETERGHYMHPELYHQPEEAGLMWGRYPEIMQASRQRRQRSPTSA
jgi:hypothetical protein